MRKIILLTLIGLTFFIPLFCFSQTNNLLITEIQISGENANEDYIKIYNPKNHTQDLSGFQLKKKSSTGKSYSIRLFPSETIIPSHKYLVWGNSEYFPDADLKSKASLSKNNSVALIGNKNKIIDAVGWGDGKNQYFLGGLFPKNPAPYQSLKRKKEGLYINTLSNKNDFYLSGEFKKAESGDKIEPGKDIFGKQSPKKNSLLNIILPEIIIAFINGIIILKIKL